MASTNRHRAVKAQAASRHRWAHRSLGGVIVVALSLFGTALTSVATAPPALAGATSTGSGTAASAPTCSAATARTLVNQDKLNDFLLAQPVAQVLCGPFTGSGSKAMAVSIGAATCWGIQRWAVFSFSTGSWKLVFNQFGFIFPLVAVGAEIKQTVPVFRATDPRCYPTGGSRGRLWHWGGTALVAGAWYQVTPPLTRGVLKADSCWSPTLCVAVGNSDSTSSNFEPLAEVWDGKTWTVQKTPATPGSGALDSVSCSAARACMALGYYQTGREAARFLAEIWDGTSWAVKSVPTPQGGTLGAVSCTSAQACTVVGSIGRSVTSAGRRYDEGATTLAEVWDGTTWAVQSTPSLVGSSYFDAVSCSSPRACTAVGVGNTAGHPEPLIERWDGAAWTVQKSPANTLGPLSAVSCGSTAACVAIGTYRFLTGAGTGQETLLAEVWDGVSWSATTTPRLAGLASLVAVSCSSARACTAVGDRYLGSAAEVTEERWDGSSWALEKTPVDPVGSLSDVSCGSARACTSVGSEEIGTTNVVLAEAWDGSSWAVQLPPSSQ